MRRREKASARKLLAAERNTLRATRAAALSVVHRVVVATSTDESSPESRASHARQHVRNAMPVMVAALAAAIAHGRSGARDDGLDDIAEHLDANPDEVSASNDEDHGRAFASASAIAAAWGGIAYGQIRKWAKSGRGSLGARLGETAGQVDPNVRRTAATETADAFNAARDEAMATHTGGAPYRMPAAVAAESDEPVQRYKVWVATLDKTCPRCLELHGTTIRVEDDFGMVPPIHPFCRCMIVVLASGAAPTDIQRAFRAELTDEQASDVEFGKAVERIDELGVTNAEYLREGYRDMSYAEGAYEGVGPETANQIARGQRKARNSDKILPPIKVVVDRGEVILRDGRHRLLAAKKAGATRIRAVVVVGRDERKVTVSIHGRKRN